MKSGLVIICLVALCACKQSPKERSEEQITKAIKRELNDPSSYEPGAFVSRPYTRADSAIAVTTALTQLMQQGNERLLTLSPSQNIEQEEIMSDNKRILAYKQKLASIPQDKLSDSVGLFVTHYFRARNALGALVKSQGDYVVYGDSVVALPPAISH